MKGSVDARSTGASGSVDPPAAASPEPQPPSQDALETASPGFRLHSALVQRHALLLVIGVAWIADFLRFERFGYYEDDWYYFPSGFGQPLLMRLQAVLPLMKSFFQGRPMLLFFETLFAWPGKASMTLPYIFVFALFITTALLFYSVLRIRFPRLFCTISTLLFVLSPLTTVRQNLVIGFIMGPAFVCVLSAILLRRRYPIPAYLLAIVALLTYESVFLLFLAAPFFERGRLRRRKWRTIAVHFAACAIIVIASVMLRWGLGEGRVLTASAVGPGTLIVRAVTLDLYYSARSFVTYAYAAWVSWRTSSLEAYVYLVGFGVWSLAVSRSTYLRSPRQPGRAGFNNARKVWWLRNGCMFGLSLIALGYLTIYFQTSGNPILYSGRDTRFSASAVPGSSMFLASLVMLMELATWRRLIWMGRAMFTVLLSVLFLYSFVIQDDYVRAWDYQKNFLSQIVLLTPDLEPDGLIVVRTGAEPQPGFGPKDHLGSIGRQRFGLLVSLKCFGDWASSPEIVFVESDTWKENLKFGPDGNLHWTQPQSGSIAQFVVPGRVIVLDERTDGLLTRSEQPAIVGGRPIQQERAPNIALGKTARQSSTFGPFRAMNGVDGHVAPVHSAWSAINRSHLLESIVSPIAATALTGLAGTEGKYAGFHTDYEPNPWWEVDLGRSFVLQQVRIYNGLPLFFRRAASLRLLLSEDDTTWRLVYENRGKLFGPEPLTINLAAFGARYVRIQLEEPNWLHLEQVEVFGR